MTQLIRSLDVDTRWSDWNLTLTWFQSSFYPSSASLIIIIIIKIHKDKNHPPSATGLHSCQHQLIHLHFDFSFISMSMSTYQSNGWDVKEDNNRYRKLHSYNSSRRMSRSCMSFINLTNSLKSIWPSRFSSCVCDHLFACFQGQPFPVAQIGDNIQQLRCINIWTHHGCCQTHGMPPSLLPSWAPSSQTWSKTHHNPCIPQATCLSDYKICPFSPLPSPHLQCWAQDLL